MATAKVKYANQFLGKVASKIVIAKIACHAKKQRTKAKIANVQMAKEKLECATKQRNAVMEILSVLKRRLNDKIYMNNLKECSGFAFGIPRMFISVSA